MFHTCACYIMIYIKEFAIESRRIQLRTIDSCRCTIRWTQMRRCVSRSTQHIHRRTLYRARACLLTFSWKCNQSWFNTTKYESIRRHGTIFPKTYHARERCGWSHQNWSTLHLLAAVTWELVLKHQFKAQEWQSREKDIPAIITRRIRSGLFRKMYCRLCRVREWLRWVRKWPHIPFKTPCSALHRGTAQLSQPFHKKTFVNRLHNVNSFYTRQTNNQAWQNQRLQRWSSPCIQRSLQRTQSGVRQPR